jgi:hypothetical protein
MAAARRQHWEVLMRQVHMRYLSICIFFLLQNCAQAFKSLPPVSIDITIEKTDNNRVRINGTTNLPDGTELAFSLEGKTMNFMAQATASVNKGQFHSELGPSKGLPVGQYVAEVVMVMPMLQPQSVRAIIGEDGERLNGPIVKKSNDDLDISVSKTFQIANDGNIIFKSNPAALTKTMTRAKSILNGIKNLEKIGRELEPLRIEDNPDCMTLLQHRKQMADSLEKEASSLPLEFSMALQLAAKELSLCVTCAKGFSLEHCNSAKKSIREAEKLINQK